MLVILLAEHFSEHLFKETPASEL